MIKWENSWYRALFLYYVLIFVRFGALPFLVYINLKISQNKLVNNHY